MNQDYLANLLIYTYLFNISKIESSLKEVWKEYQRLIDEAEKTKDTYTITKARVYLYFIGYYFPEEFAKGAIERRLSHLKTEVKFEDFVKWADSGNIPDQYKEDDLFEKILQFYQIVKSFKNMDVRGSYLDEHRFNKIYAEILGKQVSDVYVWGQQKKALKEEMEKKEAGKEFRGTVASEGKIQGKAFVIEGEENIDNFQGGCILIASITTPKFLPAMQKSLGIVTDFGGIMSHPAIIARELKIPCVVGAKGVSLAIKTGDLIEVDANKGVVRILS